LADVTLTVASPQLIGGPQETTTDAQGRYRFRALLPGAYDVTAARQGFKTLRRVNVELQPGLGFTVDFQLHLATVSEVVDVHAVVPAIDVRSSASPMLIDRQFLENLPLERRVIDYVNLVPGVVAYVAFGGSSGANPISVDGTSGNDPNFGQPWATPNANWIDQIQIVSLGANAQYGEYTGARINAISRSGSNRFSGLGDFWTTRPNWTGNNRGSLPPELAQQFRPIEILERWDAVGQLGGPIAKDDVWFFLGFERYRNDQRPFSFSSLAKTPDEPRYESNEYKTFVKLTAAPAPGLRFEGFIEFDRGDAIGSNAGPFVRPEVLTVEKYPTRLGNVRLTWTPDSRTLFEATYGGFWSHFSSEPRPPGSRSGPPGHLDQFTNIRSVNYRFFRDYIPRSNNIIATLARHVDRWGGLGHDFKAGLDVERSSLHDSSGYTGGMWFADYNGVPDLVYIWPGADHRTSFWRTSVFVQDTWTLNSRLTIEPGVRVGFYDGIASAVPNAQPYKTTSFSPRFGAAWDLGADHRTVIRAHYGHYHDPMVTSYYDIFEYSYNEEPTIVAKVLGPGQFEEVTRFGGPGAAGGLGIDPNAKHSYAEEYLAGVERELWARLSVKAQYIRRNFKEALGYVNTGTPWTPVSAIDPGPDGVLGSTDDGGPLTVYHNDHPDEQFTLLTNPSDAWRTYNAFQLIGTRRYADGWEVQASYTWSRSRGSFDNEFPSNTANAGLGANGIGVNPNWAIFRTGRTTEDRTHDVKVLGTYTLPYWGGVRVSGIYRYASGTPWGRVAYFGPLTQLCCVGPLVEPKDSRQLSATNTADLRVEKTFPLGATELGVYGDVFNINNQGIATAINATSGPNFGVPTLWINPRTLRIGVRATF
jgi:hypothetical protein